MFLSNNISFCGAKGDAPDKKEKIVCKDHTNRQQHQFDSPAKLQKYIYHQLASGKEVEAETTYKGTTYKSYAVPQADEETSLKSSMTDMDIYDMQEVEIPESLICSVRDWDLPVETVEKLKALRVAQAITQRAMGRDINILTDAQKKAQQDKNSRAAVVSSEILKRFAAIHKIIKGEEISPERIKEIMEKSRPAAAAMIEQAPANMSDEKIIEKFLKDFVEHSREKRAHEEFEKSVSKSKVSMSQYVGNDQEVEQGFDSLQELRKELYYLILNSKESILRDIDYKDDTVRNSAAFNILIPDDEAYERHKKEGDTDNPYWVDYDMAKTQISPEFKERLQEWGLNTPENIKKADAARVAQSVVDRLRESSFEDNTTEHLLAHYKNVHFSLSHFDVKNVGEDCARRRAQAQGDESEYDAGMMDDSIKAKLAMEQRERWLNKLGKITKELNKRGVKPEKAFEKPKPIRQPYHNKMALLECMRRLEEHIENGTIHKKYAKKLNKIEQMCDKAAREFDKTASDELCGEEYIEAFCDMFLDRYLNPEDY